MAGGGGAGAVGAAGVAGAAGAGAAGAGAAGAGAAGAGAAGAGTAGTVAGLEGAGAAEGALVTMLGATVGKGSMTMPWRRRVFFAWAFHSVPSMPTKENPEEGK